MAAPSRADAQRNRASILAAARRVFSDKGAGVPLGDIAEAAGVSRATLHRHFPSREDLAATVFVDNVEQIERRAAELRYAPDGAVQLFDFVLDLQFASPGLAHMLSRTDAARFADMWLRVASSLTPLLESGRNSGVVHPSVSPADVRSAVTMAAAAVVEDEAAGRPRTDDRVRAMLHRALFRQ